MGNRVETMSAHEHSQGCMDGWWVNEWETGWGDGWKKRQIGGQMDGCIGRLMGNWVGGWIEEKIKWVKATGSMQKS